jgi:hypothetical protein
MAPITRSAVLAVVVAAAATAVVRGQSESQSSQGQNEPSFVSRATAVLVDVVVRDRQGRPVLDLKPDDFELLEDGVRQEIGSFTLVSRGAGIGIDVKLKPRPTRRGPSWRRPVQGGQRSHSPFRRSSPSSSTCCRRTP